MLRLLHLALARGTRVLYENATLTASPGERIGLVGPNGCGKSTLFAAVLGELGTERGDIERPPLDRVAHVAQSFVTENVPVLDFVLSGHAPLVAAKKRLAELENSSDELALAAAHAELAELNEGAIEAQARTILAGLGFRDSDAERLVYDFSGGWRNRVALARALMCPADLLLLDEPTNHLDIDSLIWLENWLRHVEATVLIISHDREFLDRSVETIWSIEDGTIVRYAGNFTKFEAQRKAAAAGRGRQGLRARSLAPHGLHRTLSLQGLESPSGAVPHQDARAPAVGRTRAREARVAL